jgi:hypothetical protein
VPVLTSDLQALEQRWLEFLEIDCLDLLEYDFWLSPPEDLDENEEVIFKAKDWNSGPCWDLAAALRLWLGHTQVGLDTIAVHGAARVGDFYLDGNGFSSPAQMRARWLRSAIRQGQGKILRPLKEDDLHEIVNAGMVLSLARRMRSHLDKDRFLALLAFEVDSPGLEPNLA